MRHQLPANLKQYGSGIPVFRGAAMQRGHGLGSLVKGLFRTATPLLKKGALALGREAMSTGINIVEDALSGHSLKTAAKRNVSRAGKRLVKKAIGGVKKKAQTGGARYLILKKKKRGKKRVIHSEGSRAKRRRVQDIFD